MAIRTPPAPPASMRAPRRLGWLAAEFLVVVLGVVVGLAVDQWRENRSDVALEIGYLERLRSNLESDTAGFARASRINAVRAPMVDSFLAMVAGAQPFPEDPVDFVGALVASLHADFARPRRDAYDELISQGDLGRVSNLEIRQDLADYYGTIAALTSVQFVEWEETAARVELILIERLPSPVYQWVQAMGTADERVRRDQTLVSAPPPTRAQGLALLDQSRSDHELRNLLYRQARIQARLQGIQLEWAEMAGVLLDTIDAELGRLRGS